MTLPTKEEICTFVEKSIANKQYDKKIIFPLPLITIERVKKNFRLIWLDTNVQSVVML